MKLIRPMTVNDAALAASDVPETDHSAWSGATTYALGDKVRVVSTDYHRTFESVQADNTNHDPTTDDGTWWIDIGPTNRWAMFDGIVETQTTQADSIAVEITGSGRIDTVALLNVSGSAVQITVTDATDGEVYDETFSLISSDGITDAWSYCFEPVERLSDLVVTDLPLYSDATIEIALTESGATVACGVCLLGLSRQIGETDHGATVGIKDYSIKEADDFGRYSIVERTFSKRGTFQVWVENALVDRLQKMLAEYRATPILYVASEQFTSTALYGFYRDFSIEIAHPTVSICSIEIEALT